jgi:phosphoribosylanthranilate isomerase
VLVKVCGVHGESAERDLEMLGPAGVDLVGLWHRVAGGKADLSLNELARLTAAARASLLDPVLVTLESDPSQLASAIEQSGVSRVQLHGYQLPQAVVELRASSRDSRLRIVKVLHVRGRRCLELPLVAAYESAGVDVFVLDAIDRDGRVGMGEALDPLGASSVAARLGRPFLLAGGISASTSRRYTPLVRHERFAGIDVSRGARGAGGEISSRRIGALARAWRAVEDGA